MNGHYITLVEQTFLFAVWFGPPLVIASAIIIAVLRITGLWQQAKTICISVVGGVFLISPVLGFLALPLRLPSWLGVSENLWFLPLSYVIVFVVSGLSVSVAIAFVPVNSNADLVMTPLTAQQTHEKEVFLQFVQRSGLPVDPKSVICPEPPEPDIRCKVDGEGEVAFELSELCDSRIAEALDPKRAVNGKVFWTEDPSAKVMLKKLNKTYRTDVPIELLLYTWGRLVTPDDVLLSSLPRKPLEKQQTFRRVWFMGESQPELIYAVR